MKGRLANIRNNYSKGQISESQLPENPYLLFDEWLLAAVQNGELEPTAMVLSSSTPDGVPSSRIVLLKDVTERGFTFFTNYESRKGRELNLNPAAAILFFWPSMERQIRIEGTVAKADEPESDHYFSIRPRESQIGAWASPQSRKIASREVLEKSYEQVREQHKNQKIPRPPFWGGYTLLPGSIEFWQGREGRLHDRLRYYRENEVWKVERLAP